MTESFASADFDSLASPVVVCPPQTLPDVERKTIPVLHLINGEHYAGAERVQDLLALRLPETGFEVGFACLKPGRFAVTCRAVETPLFETPMHGRLDLRPVRRIARITRGAGYRLIHAHTPRALWIGRLAARAAGVPLVYHLHSPAARDSTRRLRNWSTALVERLSLAGVARVIAVSESLAEEARRWHAARGRVRVVPNGVPVVEDLAPRRRPEGRWTLGTVALFRPRKGIEILLEALAILDRRDLSVRLRAVGPFESAEYEKSLREKARELGVTGIVEWTGMVEDVAAQMARMDLLVLPSLFGEGMPMVVLEAMAAGVPVVATSVEGTAEAIRPGQDGLLVPPGDPRELARAIARLIHGEVDWEALRRSALARQADRFSDRAMARGVAQVYREVFRLGDPLRAEPVCRHRSRGGRTSPGRSRGGRS